MIDSYTPTPETCVSVSFGGKHGVTGGGRWVTYALLDACSENSVALNFKQRYLTYVEAGRNCPDQIKLFNGLGVGDLEKGTESTGKGT